MFCFGREGNFKGICAVQWVVGHVSWFRVDPAWFKWVFFEREEMKALSGIVRMMSLLEPFLNVNGVTGIFSWC